MNRAREARDLHPGAWWLWALGLAAAASGTTNPVLLLAIVAVASVTVAFRAGDHPWALSFRLYLIFGLVIVAIRVLFRVLLGGGYGGTVLLELPRIPLPDWVLGIQLLGPLTRESLLAGLYDGMRLATIVICVGAANALANPKRLLRAMPPALYEIGTALVVAISVLPQLADSLSRVRAARALRGAPSGRIRRLRGIVVPVMEDALERSMALAAGMDVRGYGRAGESTARQRWWTGGLLALGLIGLGVGAYGVLDQTAPRWTGLPMAALGVVAAGAGFVLAGRRVRRSRYRPDRWRTPEFVVAGSGIATVIAMNLALHERLLIRFPDMSTAPQLTPGALAAMLVGLVAAVAAPPARPAGSSPSTIREVDRVRAA